MATKRKNGNGRGHLPTYGSYVFTDKDHSIDELRTLYQDHFGKKLNAQQFTQVHAEGGPSAACQRGWFFGKTRRPQSATLEAAGRAIGHKRIWVPMTPKDRQPASRSR